jgi:hypothetical protein
MHLFSGGVSQYAIPAFPFIRVENNIKLYVECVEMDFYWYYIDDIYKK